jgi:hypothetical protein
MAGVPGFDASDFPGVPEMSWLRANTNLKWCGYYLEAPSHTVSNWSGQRPTLQAQGWGLAPVYVGQQLKGPGSHIVTGPQGKTDGQAAVQKMTQEGFAAGTTVYLDLEDGPPFDAARIAYVMTWANEIAAGGFGVGIYCSHGFAADVRIRFPNARIWAFKVQTADTHDVPGTTFPDLDPSGSGLAEAFIWQHEQNCRLNLPNAPVVHPPLIDLNTALTDDPGHP